MQNYRYIPHGVCSRQITFTLDHGKVYNVKFVGGCPGNLLAIGKLIEGKDAREIISILKGNDCGGKGTSCADQLAIGLERALAAEEKGA